MQKIFKNISGHNTATFVILEPDIVDFNGQKITEDEIIKTAHEFMANLSHKYVNIDHKADTKQDDVLMVESFISPVDIELGGEIIKKGSWLVAFKLSDEKWQALEKWEFVGVSMEGFGIVE